MNIDDYTALLKKEHQVKLSGAFVMYIVNALKEKQIAIMAAQEMAEEEGLIKKLEELDQLSAANEVIGEAFFEIIEGIFGEEFLSDFMEGREVVSGNRSPTSYAIN